MQLSRADILWEQPVSEPEFAAFVDWANQYLFADVADRKTHEDDGIRLAQERRLKLRQLIKTDPASALSQTVPVGVRRSLPKSVTDLLEERVSARGSLEVFGALAEPGQNARVTPTFRIATLGGREFQAFVYGRRLGEPTRHDIPLNGVAIDELLAVHENPVRVMEADEAAVVRRSMVEPICAISNERISLAGNSVVADFGGQPLLFCAPVHATQFNEQLIDRDVSGESGGGGTQVGASAATEGTKKLLFIRVDFSDLPGAPFTDAAGIDLVSGLNAFFRESSFGRSGFSPSIGIAVNSGGSDLTPILRMPQTAAYYGNNDAYLQLRTDARNAAVAAGYVMSNYDFDLYCFGAVPGFNWAGLGYVGWPGVWLRNYFSVGVAGHELGHNYGLNHANYWDTGGQSVIGAGTSSEYGDIFDTMGSANGGANHFNVRYKSYMNWLQGSETLNVTSSGVYRIYSHDTTNSAGQRVGLRIPRSSTTNYWVEFRQRFSSNKWLMNGAGIRWAGNGSERSQLLDTTPGSPDGKNDSALVVGRTFSDSAAGVHITTLRKGGTVPESIDIAVNLGTFPGNTGPEVTVTVDNPAPNPSMPVVLVATATDAQNDGLAYHWDFGDGTFGTNGNVAGKSWGSSGEYVVRCTVSDMKGGVASASQLITVGSPGTYRISGRVTANGVAVQGVKVSISTIKMTYTDSDGTYTLAGLLAGTYSVSAQLSGYSFSPSGFLNPVNLGPNAGNIDFSSGGGGGGPTLGSVNLTSPSAATTFTAPSSIFLAANAMAGTGASLVRVEFYQGATKLGEDAAFPFSHTWNNPPSGAYNLTARAIENGGTILTSLPVAITINAAAPVIYTQPQSEVVAAGSSVIFNVAATGSAPMAYRWRFNGANIAGASSATLSLFNVQPPQAGGYSVVVTNGGGAVTSATAILSVTCSYTLSASSASFSANGGTGALNVTSQGGCAWTVANVPSWIAITSGNSGSGSGPVNYVVATNPTGNSRSASMTVAGKTHTVNQAAPDTTRPMIAFTSPAANSSHTNSEVTITGTADDDNGVLRVDYKVGAGHFNPALGTNGWNAMVRLLPGTNLISVRAVDYSGNFSWTNTRALFCSIPGTLNLAVNGQGAISGATNGQGLAIGRVWKLSAKPVVGFLFSNWTGDVSGNSPSLTFMMQSNLQVTANFVANPFKLAKGDFNGLFFETDQVRLGQSGAFSLKLAEKGSYTVVLRLGARRYGVSGRMNLEGKATNIVARSGTNALTISWSVNLQGTDEISGTVSDGTWTATILGDRATFSSLNSAPQAGRYTLLTLGSPGAVVGPAGDGYGSAAVDLKGMVTIKGFLADNTSIVGKAPLSKTGYLPFYAPLYAGKGAFLGWVAFAEGPSTDLEGVISWTKPAMPTAKFYPGGFTSETALIGSRYHAPNETNSLLDSSDPKVIFSGGNLVQSITNQVTLDASGRLANLGADGLTFTVAPSRGLFSGKFTPVGGQSVTFKGAVLQKANYASGYFLGTNQSGSVFLGDEQPASREGLGLESNNLR